MGINSARAYTCARELNYCKCVEVSERASRSEGGFSDGVLSELIYQVARLAPTVGSGFISSYSPP